MLLTVLGGLFLTFLIGFVAGIVTAYQINQRYFKNLYPDLHRFDQPDCHRDN